MSARASGLIAAVLLMLGCAVAAADDRSAVANRWTSLTGTAKEIAADGFILDVGTGHFRVAFGDKAWYRGDSLKPGDRVTVTGRTDEAFIDNHTIRGDTLFVHGRSIDYFADATDRAWLSMMARVTAVDGNTLTLDAEGRPLTVDVSRISLNQGIRPGDRVAVYGTVTTTEGTRNLIADGVTLLSPP